MASRWLDQWKPSWINCKRNGRTKASGFLGTFLHGSLKWDTWFVSLCCVVCRVVSCCGTRSCMAVLKWILYPRRSYNFIFCACFFKFLALCCTFLKKPWMVPSTADVIEGLGKRNSKHVLVVPVAFTSDHIETLVSARFLPPLFFFFGKLSHIF